MSLLIDYRNWMGIDQVEEVTLLVKRMFHRLPVARDILGAGHQYMLARNRVPLKFEAGPGVFDKRWKQSSLMPGFSTISTPLDLKDSTMG